MTENQKITIQSYNNVAEVYAQKHAFLTNYNESYDEFASFIPKGGEVLDLACGPAQISLYLANKVLGLKITGVDLSSGMLKEARKNIPNGSFFEASIIDFDGKTCCGHLFDAAVLGFGIPYLSTEETKKCLLNTGNNLKDGGVFYLNFMDVRTDSEGNRPESAEVVQMEKVSFGGDNLFEIHYHNKEVVARYMKEAGFKIVKTYELPYTEMDGSITTDVVYIAKKNQR